MSPFDDALVRAAGRSARRRRERDTAFAWLIQHPAIAGDLDLLLKLEAGMVAQDEAGTLRLIVPTPGEEPRRIILRAEIPSLLEHMERSALWGAHAETPLFDLTPRGARSLLARLRRRVA